MFYELSFLIFFQGDWDPRVCCLEDVFRTVVFCFQRMVSEIETQTNGIVVILDFKDFTLHKVKQFTPPLIKTMADTVQVYLEINFSINTWTIKYLTFHL